MDRETLNDRDFTNIRDELTRLRTRVAELEASEATWKQSQTEREGLLAAEREQRLLAETLTEVTLALTSKTNHTAILDEILRQVQRVVPYSAANIMLLEENTLRCARWQGYEEFHNEEFISSLVQALTDFYSAAEAVRSRKPVVISHTDQDPRWVSLENTAWIKSQLSMPICLGNQVLGLFQLDSDTPGKFSVKDTERLIPLANAAAIALENARLYEQVQSELADRLQAEAALQERHRFEALITMISTNFINLSLDQINVGINQALQLIGEFVGADYSYVFLLSPDELTISNTHHWRAAGVRGFIDRLKELPVASFPAMRAKLNRFETVYIPSVADISPELRVEQKFLQTQQVKSLIQVPMVCNDSLTGILGFASVRAERTWSKDIIFLLKIASEIFVNALQRKQVDEELKNRAHQQEILLKEIHHRVKNNLQVVSSLLRLQARYTRDKQAREMFNDSQHRIKSMALIHAKLYQSRDLAKIDFASYVKSLSAYLFQSYVVNPATTHLNIEVDDLFLDLNVAIPCGLIINELVSNSLKHAFPVGTNVLTGQVNEIGISLRSDSGNQLVLTVWDSGVGLPPNVDPYQSESLGLQLVMRLVEQINGVVQIDSSQGTAFVISFANQNAR